ncbi:TetR/AcrR family transcriptional regulator [uncultured Cohaesibacter sp.]|uniref:TetR/AcrR family transcriptional regulator n=1 Tax=uncultured Cohaesibacter sp. TaxID=1002546 RepID=UPI0029C92B50|nr:TetR/AcrR family transcriptional regulator [uncultured Cohaesibacter sp.]
MKRGGILAAAERLFLSLGYIGTTMDAVAIEAGVTKQTVYRYFPSKVSLFSALIGHFDQNDAEFSFRNEAFAEELRRYGVAFLLHHMQPRHLAFFRLMISESRDSSELGDIFSEQAQPYWFGKLSAFLGGHVPEERCKGYAQLFNAMLLAKRTFLLMRAGEGMSEAEIRTHVELVLAVFLNGIELDDSKKSTIAHQ